MQYTTNTLIDIDTVKTFCESRSRWMLGRETELNMMMDINERADQSKGVLKSIKTKSTEESRRTELEKELAAVLKDTLQGLEKLNCFLDAVERLAVTSQHVFVEENTLFKLPKGISPGDVQVVITAARRARPLIIGFKRDASVFFLPKLQNVEVLTYQLDRYIQNSQKLCEMMTKR